jgi:hypothetical protein
MKSVQSDQTCKMIVYTAPSSRHSGPKVDETKLVVIYINNLDLHRIKSFHSLLDLTIPTSSLFLSKLASTLEDNALFRSNQTYGDEENALALI